jgi:hypothetical protein
LPPIRVVLVDMPNMLHDVVSDLIAGAAELELVGDLRDADGLDRAVAGGNADVVVAGAGSVEPGPFAKLLGAHERLAVLTIDWTGRDSRLYELRRLGEVSPDDLLATIRAAGAA